MTTHRKQVVREAATICPRPCKLTFDLFTLRVVSESRVTWHVGYFCANLSLLRPLCSRLRPDVRDRQTSDAHHRLMPPPYGGGGIIISRSICWRRATIKTAKRSQAPGDAAVLKRFFSRVHATTLCVASAVYTKPVMIHHMIQWIGEVMRAITHCVFVCVARTLREKERHRDRQREKEQDNLCK